MSRNWTDQTEAILLFIRGKKQPVPSTRWCRSTQNIAGDIKGCLFVCEVSHSFIKIIMGRWGPQACPAVVQPWKTCLFIFYRIGWSEVHVRGTRNQGVADTDSRLDFPYAQMQRLVFGMGANRRLLCWQSTYLLCIIFIHWYHCLYWPVTCNKVKGETLNEHLQFSMSRATINTAHTGSFNFGMYLRLFQMPSNL